MKQQKKKKKKERERINPSRRQVVGLGGGGVVLGILLPEEGQRHTEVRVSKLLSSYWPHLQRKLRCIFKMTLTVGQQNRT